MDINKALITAASPQHRTLPLQSLVDRDGRTKTVLTIIIEEILRAGIEQIGVVHCPGDAPAYAKAAGSHLDKLTFIEQSQPLGYAHAIYAAHRFTGDDNFLLVVGDHLYLSKAAQSCAQQLVALARAEKCAVSAVQATHESQLPYFGAIGGRLRNAAQRLYTIESVLEKPTPTEAEQKLIVPGLRAGYYLCFFGMHVLTSSVQTILGELFAQAEDARSVHFRAALACLAQQERYFACELTGQRYDIDAKYGLLTAQLAFGLAGKDRDEVLTNLVSLLATPQA